MNGNTELLNFVLQNAEMGVTTIQQLLEIVGECAIRKQLQSQLTEYTAIHCEAKQLLHRSGQDEKGLSSFEKVKTYLMINMQTFTDRSQTHIAEMMITGSTMGVVDATKQLERYKEAEPEIVGLMQRLLTFEQQNIEKLKAYL